MLILALLHCDLKRELFFYEVGIVYTTSCVKVCQRLATGRWFSPGTPVSPTNKTGRNDIP